MGIRIRVSEQDLHCLFRPTGVSRALNDRLEENALSISLFPKPLGAWWVNIRLDCDTYAAICICLFDALFALLQLQPEQVCLGAADRGRIVSLLLVKCLAAFVEGVDEFFTLVLIVAIFREAVLSFEESAQPLISCDTRGWVTLNRTLGHNMLSVQASKGPRDRTNRSGKAWRVDFQILLEATLGKRSGRELSHCRMSRPGHVSSLLP